MKNVEHFGDLTPRMNHFREAVLDKKPYIDAQRALLATEAYQKYQNQPAVMKRALMLKNILEKMSIYIEDETLIVGNQASSNKDAPIFPEYTMKFVMEELDTFEKRDGDVFYITEETKEALRSIAPFWENNNLRAKGEALLPEEAKLSASASARRAAAACAAQRAEGAGQAGPGWERTGSRCRKCRRHLLKAPNGTMACPGCEPELTGSPAPGFAEAGAA